MGAFLQNEVPSRLAELASPAEMFLTQSHPRGIDFELKWESDGHQKIPGQLRYYGNRIIRFRVGRSVLPDYNLIADEFIKRYDEESAEDKTSPPSVLVEADETNLRLTGSEYDFKLTVNPFTLACIRHGDDERVPLFESANDAHFRRAHRLPLLRYVEGRWLLSLALTEEEALYGLGEKYGQLNHRGEFIISQTHDALGVNAEISYKNIPFVWSSAGWGMWIHTPGTVEHALGYAPLSHRSYVTATEDEVLDVFFIMAPQPLDLIQTLHEILGPTPRLPDWSFGVWMSRAYYKDADECLAVAKQLRQEKLPVDVFNLDGRAWLDRETRFAFEWDASRFPNPKAFTAKLKALNYKICAWEYPLVSIKHPLFGELDKKGWLLKNQKGETYIYEWDLAPFGEVLKPLPKSGIVDFTHPEAYAWYRDAHEPLFAAGLDVIKSDFGEQVPDDAVAFNGDSGRRLHNVYSLIYNKCVYEATAKFRKGVPMVWGRAGWSGSHCFPVQWGGDPQSDWGGLSASIRGGLNWAMSGGPYYTSDIGGFYGADFSGVDPELYVRWTQAGVYSSHTRFHGIGKREPYGYPEPAYTYVKASLAKRMSLLPYWILSALEVTSHARPMMRSMPLMFPEDLSAHRYDHQYLLGYGLLVSPVVRPNHEKTTYLPADIVWFDTLSQQFIQGGSGSFVNRIYELNEIPLWVRSGAIIPRVFPQEWIGETAKMPIAKLTFYGSPFLKTPEQTPMRDFIAERDRFLENLYARWGIRVELDASRKLVRIDQASPEPQAEVALEIFDTGSHTVRAVGTSREITFS